jgi:hypothetical protein
MSNRMANPSATAPRPINPLGFAEHHGPTDKLASDDYLMIGPASSWFPSGLQPSP